MTVFEAYITNLGKYAEGQLVGETLKFPATTEEVQSLLKNIGVDDCFPRRRFHAIQHHAKLPFGCFRCRAVSVLGYSRRILFQK